MKIGIYIWHAKNENRYCIGEWDPSKKQYANTSNKEAALFRIAQEIKSKDGTSKYQISDVILDYYGVLSFYNPDNRTSHFDKIIHANLIKRFGENVQVATEFFELDKCWKNPKDIFIDAVQKTAANSFADFNPERPYSFPPRKGSQDVAIDCVVNAYKNGCKKFLLGAKCRFGKTFTSYKIMEKLGFVSTLIVTFRPTDTRDAWRNDLNTHQDFKSYQFFTQKELSDFENFTGNKVLFVSYQKLKKDLKKFLNKYKNCFDLVIIDEDQIGGHRKENREIIKKLKPELTLVNTGTPELEKMSNEFDEEFQYTWDYIDEQEAKAKGIPGYEDMPKLELYSFDISNRFADTITDKNGFSLSEFFKVEDNNFVHYAQVLKLLKYLYYDYSNGNEEPDETFGIFASAKFAGKLKHGLWKLPSVNACKCLKKVFDDNFPDVYTEVLPNGNKNPKEIEKTCAEQEKLGKSTVWLTVVKNTVGVTVKPWTYTISLYGSGDSSLTSYIQYIFRAGSPGKDTFYSFDFCPERILDVADQFAQVRATKHNTSYDYEIAKVLNYLPLFAYNGVGGWESLETKNFFNSISKFSTIRATSNLIKDYLLELVEYEKELADVEVGSLNPQTSHNAEIGKLKKDLLKKAKKSGKTDKEPSSKDLAEKLFQAFIDIYTFVKFANDGVESLDDFIKKLNTYDGECEDYFGFSDDFIKTLIAVMNSEKRCFEIAIQRFKHIDLKFAMEDVPDELAKRMIQKLDLKKGDTVCDWCCKGVGLLKNIPAGHKLYAKVEDKRTELIVKKLLPNVNIIKDTTMKFDHIIMNPPYDKNLHLKILQEAMKHSDDVVNLSPIRWLQDPLAEYKKNSDWKKFESVRKRIDTLDVVPMVEATQLFNSAAFSMDIGIYHLTSQGGWTSRFTNSIINKVVEHSNKTVSDAMSENEDDGWRVRIKKLMPIPSNRPNGTALEYTNTYLCHQSLDWVYKDGFTKEGAHWSENKLAGAGGPKSYTKDDKLPYSIKFDTEEEAYNFQAYTKTKFFKYIYSTMKTDQNVPLKYLPYMPTYTHPWTDEMLYEYFGLTKDEVEEIEQDIK